MERLRAIGHLRVQTQHEVLFLGRGRRKKIRYYCAFDLHDSLGKRTEKTPARDGGGAGEAEREARERDYLLVFKSIPGLPGLSDSARGRKCVMLSDNRGGRCRDKHVSSRRRG